MRNKKNKILLVTLFIGSFSGLQSQSLQPAYPTQTMYVRALSGPQYTYPVYSIQKLTFSGNNLLIKGVDNTTYTQNISGIRYISFFDFGGALLKSQITNSEKLVDIVKSSSDDKHEELNKIKDSTSPIYYAFPNPVNDVLNISTSIEDNLIDAIEILTLDGRSMIKQNLINNSTTQILVNTLPQGIYFCRITSGNITKYIKFLKQ